MNKFSSRRKYLQAIRMSLKTLKDFGYGFNEDGILKQLDDSGQITEKNFEFTVFDDPGKNQRRYEDIGETITEEVYKLLQENGMHKIYVPENSPQEESAFVFASKPVLKNIEKLLILIHGSGVVRAGQWSRSLIINQSINHGTQIPYIKKGRELGYEILILNTNDNYRTKDGARFAIPGHYSPTAHASSIWDRVLLPSNPQSVAIVAHSYGGLVTVDLAKNYTNFFKEKVFAIGFTDSVHSMLEQKEEIVNIFMETGRNWVTSKLPLDAELSSADRDLPRFSAGHTKHEWTSYSCISALFDFFEKKYEEFKGKKD